MIVIEQCIELANSKCVLLTWRKPPDLLVQVQCVPWKSHFMETDIRVGQCVLRALSLFGPLIEGWVDWHGCSPIEEHLMNTHWPHHLGHLPVRVTFATQRPPLRLSTVARESKDAFSHWIRVTASKTTGCWISARDISITSQAFSNQGYKLGSSWHRRVIFMHKQTCSVKLENMTEKDTRF